jgi:hypothetical protein
MRIYNPHRTLGPARDLGEPIPQTCWNGPIGRHTNDRLNTRQGASLGSGRKSGAETGCWSLARRAQHEESCTRRLLTGREAHDWPVAERLIDRGEPAEHLLSDKAYDSNELRNELWSSAQTSYSQPAATGSAVQFPQAPKDFRRIATRCDKPRGTTWPASVSPQLSYGVNPGNRVDLQIVSGAERPRVSILGDECRNISRRLFARKWARRCGTPAATPALS